MAVNVTKTSHFTSGAGNPISFSQIRAEFGGSATNIKASTYLRNDDAAVDWDDESTITSRVPDATENSNVASNNDWSVNSLRDTISNYLVVQSQTNTELSYTDSDTDTWNNNLSKNVPKTFDVTGVIHADNVNDDALRFSGDLYNLDIEVDASGAIYGEGGAIGGNGGDALYVNNTYTQRKVDIRSYGKIWAGGGGGSSGSDGSDGGGLDCYNSAEVNSSNDSDCPKNLGWFKANPTGQRNRCRGRGARKGDNPWNESNGTGYHCGNGTFYTCIRNTAFVQTGGSGGSGGNGGVGRGWSNRNTAMTVAPHIGNPGNSGNTNTCTANRTSSTGNSGSPGNSGGDWGVSSTGTAGRAIQKKGAQVNYYTDNTVKGSIIDI